MYEINRSLAIILPKQPFLDWLIRSDETIAPDITLAELRRDANALLIPECDDEDSAMEFIYANYEELFVRELEDWVMDERTWPQKRSLRMFQDWFEVEVHSMVTDMVEDDIPNQFASLSLH